MPAIQQAELVVAVKPPSEALMDGLYELQLEITDQRVSTLESGLTCTDAMPTLGWADWTATPPSEPVLQAARAPLNAQSILILHENDCLDITMACMTAAMP